MLLLWNKPCQTQWLKTRVIIVTQVSVVCWDIDPLSWAYLISDWFIHVFVGGLTDLWGLCSNLGLGDSLSLFHVCLVLILRPAYRPRCDLKVIAEVPKGKWKHVKPLGLGFELAQCHFCLILLARLTPMVKLRFTTWKIDSTS